MGTALYISSAENFEADVESRRRETDTEWELSEQAYSTIVHKLGCPSIDLFATRVNKKCSNFVSWFPDPEAVNVDAFTISWSNSFFYAFPPFCLISRVLRKIKADKANGIVVIPYWTSQPWFPIFENLLHSELVIFKPNKNLLFSIDRKPHPLWEKLTLAAGILSGRPFN